VLPLRVGNDVATIDDVMGVIEILSSRREYTKINPFVVLLGKGEHEITSDWTDPYGTEYDNEYATMLEITRSNITFVGTGKDTTTILGGFAIRDLENITFKQMTVTNTSTSVSNGIRMTNVKVELFDVALKGCRSSAFFLSSSTSETIVVATRCEFANNSNYGARVYGSLTSATFKNCLFHSNKMSGIYGYKSTIHLHGEATAIHSNKNGIYASVSCTVLIHLPSHHNTCYNNRDGDRKTIAGGTIEASITITNVED